MKTGPRGRAAGAGPSFRLVKFRIRNFRKRRFTCPLCRYRGPFEDVAPDTGVRRHARCPACGSMERHRLQFLVLKRILEDRDPSQMRVLHIAPEEFFRPLFSSWFEHRDTADLERFDVDLRLDLCRLPFPEETYDCVFASHVLEHVPRDVMAVAEIRRVLKPGGLAILPVPLVAERTIEYPAPNPFESGHVRAPGLDYYHRFETLFSSVDLYPSTVFPDCYQTYEYEDRTAWPTEKCPLLPPMEGERHVDIVPVCRAG